MSKQFIFSTKTEVELSADKMVIKLSYGKRTIAINNIKEVFMKKPAFLSSGYISVNDKDYIYFKKKDMEQALSLLEYLEGLGVLVVYLRKKCTDTYLECRVTVGGVCSFLTISIDKLIYYPFSGEIEEVDLSSFKYVVVTSECLYFAKSEDYFKDLHPVSLLFDKRFYSEAVAFAKNVVALNPSYLSVVEI